MFIVVYLIYHLAYPLLHKESFVVIHIMFIFTSFKMVNTIRIFHSLLGIPYLFHSCAFQTVSSLIFIGNMITMIHDVGLLDAAIELDRLTTLCFTAGAGFNIFMWPLCGVIFGLFLSTLHYL